LQAGVGHGKRVRGVWGRSVRPSLTAPGIVGSPGRGLTRRTKGRQQECDR
jgi:hypothetical protein